MVLEMREYVENLVKNQYTPSKNFSMEDLEQIDYKIHDWYQEYTDLHPGLPVMEIVQILAYNVHIKNQSLESRNVLLEEFMSTNLAKLYVIMIEERRQLQKEGRFPL